MEIDKKIMQFYFITSVENSTHYHQNLEILYVLKGVMDVQIDDVKYTLKDGDFILVNANKRHSIFVSEKLLGARFVINFRLLAEYMGSMQMMFWCNTVVDKNDVYQDVRKLLDQILDRYFEKDDKGALYLNALYFQTLYLLTTNFMVKALDARFRTETSQDRIRVRQIQNYIQANYQSRISLNDLADKLFLSNAYLSKYVKKHLGMTFLDYLNNVRLFHAVDEMLYTSKNITQIAMDNGFPTSAAFTKSFRDIHGESPSEYRRKMKQSQLVEEAQGVQEEDRQKILEYLRFKETREEPEAKHTHICVADTKRAAGCNLLWNKAVNVGEACSLLQSEVQNQLLEIQRETGMVYARIWNLLNEEDCFDERKNYNFRKLDLVLDFLVDNHMKPYIELGNKPSLVLYTPEQKPAQKEHKTVYEYEMFGEIVRALCLHLVNRYGVDEVEGWYFEYWNDPQLHMEQEDGAYYAYFQVIYQTLKEISPEIRVGGAGFILGYELAVCRDIFCIWNKKKIRPDFLSFCSFQYISFAELGQYYGKKSIDGHYMKHQVEMVRELMEETGFHIPELHIDEWNFTVSSRNVLNDSCSQGAYILKTCISMTDDVDCMAYWRGLDSYSGQYNPDSVLNGDSGMLSRDGIRKPSFYAFQFMNKLQPYVLSRDDFGIVTTNRRGRYVIACHNHKQLTPDYVLTEEEQITIERQEQFMENREVLNLTFRLLHVRDGSYQIRIYYVNKENGSAQEIWRKLEYEKRLGKEEVEYLKKRAVPSMEMRTVQVENGVLELENRLEAQEIRLLDICYRYSM